MTGERERIKRAGTYVLGLMDDEERERAERDLELDPAFRDAVLQMAERAHVFDLRDSGDTNTDEGWSTVLDRISALPQMRGTAHETGAEPTKGGVPVSNVDRNAVGTGPIATGTRLGLAIALGLVVAFALGYLLGKL